MHMGLEIERRDGGRRGGGRERRREKKQICRFTKSCTSQCLSCFAAPLSVVRAETSVTGSLARRSHKLTTAKLQTTWLMTKTAETFLRLLLVPLSDEVH